MKEERGSRTKCWGILMFCDEQKKEATIVETSENV